MSRKQNKHLIGISVLCIWIEINSAILLKILAFRFPNAVYTPPSRISVDEASKRLGDPNGWGSDQLQLSSSELAGSDCKVHLFGDSFMEANTYETLSYDSQQKTPEDILALKTGCSVFNYAVGGYGSDQSYLKFIAAVDDKRILKGDFVVLSHLTENILRNANRNRSLLYPRKDRPIRFKPVFALDDSNELALIPIPDKVSSKTLGDLATNLYPDAFKYGEDPRFVPGQAIGSPSTFSFPYTFNAIRALTSWHLLPRAFNSQRYDQFYRADDSSYKVTMKLIKSFHEKCEELECISLSVDLPVSEDFGKYFTLGENKFLMTHDLQKLGLNHKSVGHHQMQSYPQLTVNRCFLHDGSLDGGDSCSAHYNRKGYLSFYSFLSEIINLQRA